MSTVITATEQMKIFDNRFAMSVLGLPKTQAAAYTAVSVNEYGPMIVGSAVVIFAGPKIPVLQHVVVWDEYRRRGWGMKIVKWISDQYGGVGALWATPEGVAFARAYEAKHGHQPWQIGI